MDSILWLVYLVFLRYGVADLYLFGHEVDRRRPVDAVGQLFALQLGALDIDGVDGPEDLVVVAVDVREPGSGVLVVKLGLDEDFLRVHDLLQRAGALGREYALVVSLEVLLSLLVGPPSFLAACSSSCSSTWITLDWIV